MEGSSLRFVSMVSRFFSSSLSFFGGGGGLFSGTT